MPGGIAGGPGGCGSSPSVTHLSRSTGRCWNASGRGGETAYIELPKALQALGQECFVFCRCAAEHVVGGVRFVPWERMAEYRDLNPDVLVTSRWFDPLTWPALAGARKCCGCRTPTSLILAAPSRSWIGSSCPRRGIGTTRFSGTGHGIDAGKLRVINLGIRREHFDAVGSRRQLGAPGGLFIES